MKAKWFSTLLVVLLVVAAMVPAAGAAPANVTGEDPNFVPKEDNLSHPLGEQQAALRQMALDAKLNGKAHGRTHEVARGQFVELERTGEDSIWTVLGEFSDLAHNEIPQPDRSVDNTTIWAPDFSRDHYMDLLFSEAAGFSSMRNFYIELSSNLYTVNGDVTNWVTVPGNAASYNDDLGGDAVWQFLQDSLDAWYDTQIAAGKTPAEIDAYLSQFDGWDRYDWDQDGNFYEADGYIDHFQSVHAGMGEEVGGGVLGVDAIWSHRWYARYGDIGVTGPSADYLLGGVKIGDSSYWIGDYTIEPENGGVGVFSHEFAHDLGLPDLYDTQASENSTGFWTLMSQGSYGNDGTEDIGSRPIHMGVWEKFQLGWVNNYDVAFAGQSSSHKIGPAETSTKQAQALFVVLPPKPVTSHISDPYEGAHFYYSGSANNLNNRMTKAFTLPAGATLTAKVNYGIEEGYDYANVIVSTDGGATWQTVPTNLSNSTVEANGIEGFSNGWVELTANLPAGNVMVGFQYRSDGGVNFDGFMVDNIEITGYPLDGAEADAGWTFSGFRVTTGTEDRMYTHYYVAEFRQYRGYDDGLRTGVYNFGWANNPALANWVEHFSYQDGLLISYWDNSQADNNTSAHPGQGLILPIDAHPDVLMRGATPWRNRVQSYDSTFGLERTDGYTLHFSSNTYVIPSLPAVPVFNDSLSYWRSNNPRGSVIVPNTGTKIRVVSYSAQGNFLQVVVSR